MMPMRCKNPGGWRCFLRSEGPFEAFGPLGVAPRLVARVATRYVYLLCLLTPRFSLYTSQLRCTHEISGFLSGMANPASRFKSPRWTRGAASFGIVDPCLSACPKRGIAPLMGAIMANTEHGTIARIRGLLTNALCRRPARAADPASL